MTIYDHDGNDNDDDDITAFGHFYPENMIIVVFGLKCSFFKSDTHFFFFQIDFLFNIKLPLKK